MGRFKRIGKLKVTMTLNGDKALPGPELTVPIIGIPRGGTTMVAKVVEALGIPLGPKEDLERFNMEDQTMHVEAWDTQVRCLRERNNTHAIWGWKDPTGVTSVQRIIFALRNPHIVIVFRDMLATLQAEMRYDVEFHPETSRPFDTVIEQTLNWWNDNFRFIRNVHVPMLLVSYERALINPELFIEEIAVFLRVNLTPLQMEKAKSCINLKGGYLP